MAPSDRRRRRRRCRWHQRPMLPLQNLNNVECDVSRTTTYSSIYSISGQSRLVIYLVLLFLFDNNAECHSNSNQQSSLRSIPLIPHHVYEQRIAHQHHRHIHRHRRLSTTTTTPTTTTNDTVTSTTLHHPYRRFPSAALYGGYGTHYVDLWCGTPHPQRQTLIVDTGSDITAFPCTSQTHQNHNNPQRQRQKEDYCPSGEQLNTVVVEEDGDVCGVGYHLDPLYRVQQSQTFTPLSCPNCFHGKCRSNTPNDNRCHLHARYREGSGWEALEVQDECYLGGYHQHQPFDTVSPSDKGQDIDGLDPLQAPHFRFPLKFACQTLLKGAFQYQLASGIMGMQRRSPSSFFRQVANATTTQGDIHNVSLSTLNTGFSLCFAPTVKEDPQVLWQGVRAGLMTLGGFDPRVNEAPMVYSRGTHSHSKYFSVVLRKIYLQPGLSGKHNKWKPTTDRQDAASRRPILLNVSEGVLNYETVMIDSGSTDTYMTKDLTSAFQEVWRQLVGKDYDSHERLYISRDEILQYPTIVFQLKGKYKTNTNVLDNQVSSPLLANRLDPDHPYDVLVSIPPYHYFEYSKIKRKFYARFHFDEDRDSAFGASAMLGYNIHFDGDSQHIGWAPSSCNYDEIVANHIQNGLEGPQMDGSKVDSSSREEMFGRGSEAKDTTKPSSQDGEHESSADDDEVDDDFSELDSLLSNEIDFALLPPGQAQEEVRSPKRDLRMFCRSPWCRYLSLGLFATVSLLCTWLRYKATRTKFTDYAARKARTMSDSDEVDELLQRDLTALEAQMSEHWPGTGNGAVTAGDNKAPFLLSRSRSEVVRRYRV